MKNVCLLTVFGLVACAAIEFEQQPRASYQVQETNYDYNNYGEPATAVEAVPVSVGDASSRTHHGKHKLKKKLKKRLLHCLLQQHHGRRRRRDATGRFFIPLVSQNTNVNVGGGSGSDGYGGQHQQHYGGGGCMQMFNDHGPSLGSLGGALGSLGGAFGSPAAEEDGNRAGTYAADWNRYARQFRRNIVRPLYQLF